MLGLLSGSVRLAGRFELGAGATFRRTGIGLSRTTSLGEGYLMASAPLTGAHRLHLMVRHQRPGEGDGLTIAALGVTFAALRR